MSVTRRSSSRMVMVHCPVSPGAVPKVTLNVSSPSTSTSSVVRTFKVPGDSSYVREPNTPTKSDELAVPSEVTNDGLDERQSPVVEVEKNVPATSLRDGAGTVVRIDEGERRLRREEPGERHERRCREPPHRPGAAAHARGAVGREVGRAAGRSAGDRRARRETAGRDCEARALANARAHSRLGSARLGSARLGSARLGSARLGSARLGSALNYRD